MHVSAHVYEGMNNVRIIIQHFSTLFIEEGSLNQAPSSLVQLVWSLLWGSPFSCFHGRKSKWLTMPTQHLSGLWESKLQVLLLTQQVIHH